MSRRCRRFKYVRSSTGRRVRRCARYGSGRRLRRHGHRPANKGAHCARFKRVFSPFWRKRVLRCASYQRFAQSAVPALPEMPLLEPQLAMPAWTTITPQMMYEPLAPATADTPVRALLPANAASLRNRERTYRRLQSQMRKMQRGLAPQEQTSSRWPGDRPKKRKS